LRRHRRLEKRIRKVGFLSHRGEVCKGRSQKERASRSPKVKKKERRRESRKEEKGWMIRPLNHEGLNRPQAVDIMVDLVVEEKVQKQRL